MSPGERAKGLSGQVQRKSKKSALESRRREEETKYQRDAAVLALATFICYRRALRGSTRIARQFIKKG